jgi:predicted TIM-barrel fold metal-dependent hydrolase
VARVADLKAERMINAIDCDVHPTATGNNVLLPYLETYWRDSVQERGMGSLESASYPPNAPITARPDFRGADGYAATDASELSSQVLDRWGASHAILNCLYGVQLIFNEDMARVFAAALNDWIAKEWLDRDPRLRASIVVPM